jgi:hypothetical protein
MGERYASADGLPRLYRKKYPSLQQVCPPVYTRKSTPAGGRFARSRPGLPSGRLPAPVLGCPAADLEPRYMDSIMGKTGEIRD